MYIYIYMCVYICAPVSESLMIPPRSRCVSAGGGSSSSPPCVLDPLLQTKGLG